MIQRLKNIVLGIIIITILPIQSVRAFDPMETYQGEMVKDNPATWIQSNDFYGSQTFTLGGDGDSFAGASCGIHSLAAMFAKMGYTPANWDGKSYNGFDWPALAAHEWAMDHSYGWNYGYSGSGNVIEANSGGKIKHIATTYYNSLAEQEQGIKDGWAKGYFMINSGFWNGISHITSIDYVDTDGNVVIIDSGWRYKYYDSMTTPHYVMFYEYEGQSIQDAPRFWDGEAMTTSGPNDGGNNNSTPSGQLFDPSTFDPMVPLDNPIVKYEEHRDRGHQDSLKGVDKEDGFLNWLFR